MCGSNTEIQLIVMSAISSIKTTTLAEKIILLTPLVDAIQRAETEDEKYTILQEWPQIKKFLKEKRWISLLLSKCSKEEEIVIYELIAIEQAERLLNHSGFNFDHWHAVARQLFELDFFYQSIGGVIGYHYTTLKLLLEKNEKLHTQAVFHPFPGHDICSDEDPAVRKAIIWGIRSLKQMAELYPIGGAADRLKLQDEKGNFMPAAKLFFCGKTLIERLVNDLQAKEYLHYKLFGERLCTPIAMMTSYEKENHWQIIKIFEEQNWFGRSKESFRFFSQPLVPTMDQQGNWCLQGPLQLLLKPGGHGVIWKVALENGIFDWFYKSNKQKALVRQINNLAAGLDYGLLAFTGIGCREDKKMGFASCPRVAKTSEGMNVLIEHPQSKQYVLTNVEYCDFKKYQIADEPLSETEPFSPFSSNTNLLFVDLNAIEEAVKLLPIPGMLVNLKKMQICDHVGQIKEEEVVRLESTMQNIADAFVQSSSDPLHLTSHHRHLNSYLTFNQRPKTISALKREFTFGSTLTETPEGCYLDLLQNARDLLVNYCKMQVPDVVDPLHFFIHGPSFIFQYHPALGPLYSIIAQKMSKGRIAFGSELRLEIADVFIQRLDLNGSLLIHAKNLMGHNVSEGLLEYSNQTGKCILKNVSIRNQGIDREASNIYWKNEIQYKESCVIELEGSAEFVAENVCLEGNLKISVPHGKRLIAIDTPQGIQWKEEDISKPTWTWKHLISEDDRIILHQQTS